MGAIAFTSCAGAHLLLGFLLTCLSDPWTERSGWDPSGWRVPAECIRTSGCSGWLLVCAHSALAGERATRAQAALGCGPRGLHSDRTQPLAASRGGGLLYLLPVIRQHRPGFLLVSIGWDVARCRVPLPVLRSFRFASGDRSRSSAFPSQPVSFAMALVPHLL